MGTLLVLVKKFCKKYEIEILDIGIIYKLGIGYRKKDHVPQLISVVKLTCF